ncbi:hypothetical protein [Ochrobactrum sp. 3-3]|uniref:hypothetical protein n=1 Tax=Ochrobactrum sp. 3-3 TaxID=1830124 RepID=UPI0013B3B073|nr:hypothetical protein [Ochrobactrum sp. 3-3]
MAFTVNALIGNNIVVYRNTVIRVLFTGSVDPTDPTPENPYVQIDSLNLNKLDVPEPEQYEHFTVPLVPDPDNEGQWIGEVFGTAPGDATNITLTGSANSDTVQGILNTTDVPVGSSDDIQDDPIPPLTPTMETAPREHMTPSEDTDGKYTKIFKVAIYYTANDGSLLPYKNYVVEWNTIVNSDFSDRFNVYGSATATEALASYRLGQTIYYRTATNTNGIAELYIVSSKKMASEIISCYTTRLQNKKFGSIASIDLNPENATLELSAPDLNWPNPVINLNDTNVRNFQVLVDYGSTMGDAVYIYLNGFLNSVTTVGSSGATISDSISRYNLKSTTYPEIDSKRENKLFYAVAQHGTVRTSRQTWFKATGNPGPAEPEDVDRILPAPFLINHSRTINADLIQGGLLIFATKKDEKGQLIAAAGDNITARIFVNAFEDGTNTPKHGVFSGEHTVDQTSIDDPADFIINIAEKSLKGFDSDRNGNTGLAQIEYFVSKPDGTKIYSRLDSCRIDTAPPHGKKLLK